MAVIFHGDTEVEIYVICSSCIDLHFFLNCYLPYDLNAKTLIVLLYRLAICVYLISLIKNYKSRTWKNQNKMKYYMLCIICFYSIWWNVIIIFNYNCVIYRYFRWHSFCFIFCAFEYRSVWEWINAFHINEEKRNNVSFRANDMDVL